MNDISVDRTAEVGVIESLSCSPAYLDLSPVSLPATTICLKILRDHPIKLSLRCKRCK